MFGGWKVRGVLWRLLMEGRYGGGEGVQEGEGAGRVNSGEGLLEEVVTAFR